MKKLFKVSCLALAVLAGASSLSAQGFGRRQQEDPTGYKDTYKDYFTVGVAVNMRNVTDKDQIALIKKNFNSITAENDMKPVSLQPEEGKFNWENADKIANFCRENNIPILVFNLNDTENINRAVCGENAGTVVS